MSFVKQYIYKKQYSTDEGLTWYDVEPAEYKPDGEILGVYETIEECRGEVPGREYRWVVVPNDYICVGETKYEKTKEQVSYDSGVTWDDVSPVQYRIGNMIERESSDCIIYRYTSGTPYCQEYDKYIDVTKQASFDDGTTWQTVSVSPRIVEIGSEFCGYNPPYRLTVNYLDGHKRNVQCSDGAYSSVASGTVLPSSAITSAIIGECCTGIGTRAFSGCSNIHSITVLPTTPPSLSYDAFLYSNDCPIYVPCNSLQTYLSANNWKLWGSRILGISPCVDPFKFKKHLGTGIYIKRDCTDTTITRNEMSSTTSSMTELEIGDCVTSIGGGACSGCTKLTSVTIPDNVTSIGYDAFRSCSSLTSVTVLATTPPTLGSAVFDGSNSTQIYVPCESAPAYRVATRWSNYAARIHGIQPCQESYKFTASYSDGKLWSVVCNNNSTLTSGETKPAGYAYTAMTSAYIGDCVTSIGVNAFYGCTGLTSCTIGSGTTSIGNSAFKKCTSLTSIVIPNSVTSIGSEAFSGCTSLRSINIPDGITSINPYTFDDCYSLISITIPDSVTSIGNRAFNTCTGLTSADIKSGSIGERAFSGCRSLTTCTIGSGVTSIGYYSFASCPRLTSIVIPGNVTSVGDYAFNGCTGLTSVTIGSGVTSIGNRNFVDCSGLTSIVIPGSVTSIGYDAFSGCSSLTSVTVEATTPPTLGSNSGAFNNTNNCPIYVPYNSVSRYKSATGWVRYKDRITSLEQHKTTSGSPYCTGYDKYVDVYSQVSYDAGATWATASTTPTLVEAWSQDCGYVPLHRTTTGTPYCTGVDKYADVYNQVSYDNGTTWVTTATTATLVEHNSQDCGYMERTTSGNPYCVGRDKYVETFDQVSYDSGETWTTTSSAITLVETDSQDCGYSPIPSGVKARFSYINGDVYSAACDSNTTLTTGDTQPAGYSYPAMGFVEIGSCITSIGYYAFSGCTSLTSIVIPNSVTSIGSEAFSGCTSLRSINIPDNVTSINYRTFHYCSGLTSCTIGSGVTSIGTGAFGYCSSLTSVTIPDSVTSIGSSAFWNCDGITSIDNIQNVTSIGWGAFYDCDSLTGVTIGSSITSIDGAAFSQCVNLTSVTVLATTPPTLGDNVFFTSTGVHVTIYVPAGSVETYKTASGWSTYASRIQAIP